MVAFSIFPFAPIESEGPPKLNFSGGPHPDAWGPPGDHQKSLNFGGPSLSTGAIAKIENATIHLDKVDEKIRSRLSKLSVPL